MDIHWNITLLVVYLQLLRNVCTNSDIKLIAENLSQDINLIKNEELGIPFINKFYSNFKFALTSIEAHNDVEKMAQKLNDKVEDIFSSLQNAQLFLEGGRSTVNTSIPSIFIPCLPDSYDADEQGLFSGSIFSENNTLFNHLEVGSILHRVKNNMGTIKNAVKQQFIITDNEHTKSKYSPFSGCNNHDDSIVWNNYMSRNKYEQRNVILILDHGGSLNKKQINIVKSMAKQIVISLHETDRIAMFGISENISVPDNTNDCPTYNSISKPANVTSNLKYSDSTYKHLLNKFIDSLVRGSGATNHTMGMETALKIIQNESGKLKNKTVMVLYISRGLLSSLMEPKIVLEVIARYSENITTSMIIHTCAVIDESKSILYETDFLRDIAEQNYEKYNHSYKTLRRVKPGFMLAINSTDSVGFALSVFYNIFNKRRDFNTEKKISLPDWDSTSRDLTVSFSTGFYKHRQFSMIAADVYFSNIAEDVTYYSSNQKNSYAFLVDTTGLVLMHPSYPRPSTVHHKLTFVDISKLEKVKDVQVFKYKLLSEVKGLHETTDTNGTSVVKYYWRRIGDWYIICIAVNNQYNLRPFKSMLFPSASNAKLFYQNLDRVDDYKLCKHLNQLATKDASSLYLSLSCFKSPFYALKTSQEKLISQGYLAYLKDDTRLLVNPGLKDEVRDEVVALAHIIEFMRKQHLTSMLSKYVVRRYATSYSGVLQMFPGSILGPGLEPTKRPWFLRAIQHQDRVVFIPPYLDGGGAGYIVTMAYATAQTVAALDVTYGYVYKMILEYMPFCLEEKVTCFLMDDQGYLIYHPNLMQLNEAKPIEQKHIVHKESLVANDILNHKHFIRKLLCNNYGNSTIQRYYRLNTSFSDVLANFVPGEHCVTYRITTVPNTNIFVGIVNATCDVVATFCPCSVVDRLCLNCNRMEQKECECPCECPLNTNAQTCNANITDNNPCMWYTEDVSQEPPFIEETDRNLDSCFPVNCQAEETYLDCLGLTGCEWCKFDTDGNYLRKPFCSSLSTCFNGVFGSATPYKDNTIILPDNANSDLNPIGPILGSIIAMCILFVLLFVCYRSYTTPSTERLYLSSTQDNQLRMSDLNVNDNYHDLGNHRDKLLQEDRPDPVSPYCVASTYRRAATAADSDHGYSTMTPHDESEHLSLAPVEGDSQEDDFGSDNASVRTSVSVPGKHHASPPCFTRIPNKNSIIVPVTVHRNMEAS
ncbi:unnamed protein product [Brassicogethes aeneus]|uniref:VWFA domain-containing protein n=1 Tax=Brassicogethes aeneus TaxID=1431903 RepID=A0A9P0BEJ7_BRAAE|nr:unnamed protein product [Brassicogethes aeneus]